MSLILHDEQFLPAAISLVANATSSIYISSFKLEIIAKTKGLQLMQFFNILIQKTQAGIDVRVLTNKQAEQGHVPFTNAAVLNLLKSQKVPARYLQESRITHAKLIIADKKHAIVGSHNLSYKSCHSNFEVSCYIECIADSRYLADIFEHVWNNAKDI